MEKLIEHGAMVADVIRYAKNTGMTVTTGTVDGDFRVLIDENLGDEAAPHPYPCANTGKCGHYTAESDPGCSGCGSK